MSSKDEDEGNVINLFDDDDLVIGCECGSSTCYLSFKDNLIVCAECGDYAENFRWIEVEEVAEDD